VTTVRLWARRRSFLRGKGFPGTVRIRQSVGSASGDRLAPRPRATPVKSPPKEEEAAAAAAEAVGGEGASEGGGGLVDGLRNVQLGDAAAEVNGRACSLLVSLSVSVSVPLCLGLSCAPFRCRLNAVFWDGPLRSRAPPTP